MKMMARAPSAEKRAENVIADIKASEYGLNMVKNKNIVMYPMVLHAFIRLPRITRRHQARVSHAPLKIRLQFTS